MYEVRVYHHGEQRDTYMFSDSIQADEFASHVTGIDNWSAYVDPISQSLWYNSCEAFEKFNEEWVDETRER